MTGRLAVLAAALAAGAFLAAPAAAQHTVWSGTLTVDRGGIGAGCANFTSSIHDCTTGLRDRTFRRGGTTIDRLYWDSGENEIRLETGTAPTKIHKVLGPLTLKIGSLQFDFAYDTVGGINYRWPSGDPGWTDGQRLPVSLTTAPVWGVHVSNFALAEGRKAGEFKVSWKARHVRPGGCGYRVEWRRKDVMEDWDGENFYTYRPYVERTIRYLKPLETYEVRVLVRPPLRTQQPRLVFTGETETPGTPPPTSQMASPQPALSVADAEAAEGGTLSFAVTLDGSSTGPVTVDWATADGTAMAGADYEGSAGALTFAAGETAKTVTVATLADAAEEETETLTLVLRNPSGAVLADAEATGSIANVAPVLQRAPEEPVTSNSRDDQPLGKVSLPEPAPEPVTARVVAAPSEHGGKGKAFTVRIAFSAPVTVGATKAVREGTVRVGNGRVTRSTRVKLRKDLWQFRIKPVSHGDVTVALAQAADCAAPGAMCTEEGGRLSPALTATVQGPPSLSVASARAREGRDATMAFAVTLSRAAAGPVTVDYATRDGTAVAGADYTAASGTLSFAAGETEKTVAVTVLDDAVDEGRETFHLRLSNPRGAYLAKGGRQAKGVIRNEDPLQRMWLSRFGRTVAGQTVEALEGRFAAGSETPSHMTLAGQRLDFAGAPLQRHDRWTEGDSRGMDLRELMLGSSFHFTAGEASGLGAMTGWGKALSGSSSGSLAGGLSFASETMTGLLGMDWERDNLLVGLALTESVETGGAVSGASGYDIEGSFSMVAPYARIRAGERLSFWSVIGSGRGDMSVSYGGASQSADLAMQLAAAGARAELLRPEDGDGLSLALRTDAFFVRAESASVSAPGIGNLAAAAGDASRVRAVLEGSRSFALAGGGALEPSLTLGLRHDGGDAETGSGVEIGTGVSWSDPSLGLTSDLRFHGLAAHEDGSYDEWGVSGSLRMAPDPSGRGLSLSMSPSWGAERRGGRIWDARPGALVDDGGEPPGARLDTELGYGLSLSDGLTGMPYVGLGFGRDRDYRLGWRLASDRLRSFSLGVEAARREPATDKARNEVTLRGGLRW